MSHPGRNRKSHPELSRVCTHTHTHNSRDSSQFGPTQTDSSEGAPPILPARGKDGAPSGQAD
eukprot:5103590-Prymnesium_polylepis.1